MTHHTSPRAASAAHKVMCHLVDLGGKASMSQLITVLGAEYRSDSRFYSQVTDQVLKYGLATVQENTFTVTKKGRDVVAAYHDRFLPKAAPYVGQIAAPRIAPPMRPLNTAKHFPQTVVREGAFDHQKIPSLMGGKRILPSGEVLE
jgi:hypothetical protein